MSARIVTLTQSDYTIDSSPSSRQQDDDNSNLLEIVRFVKREKEIATVKQEMAESECLQLKHKSQKLEKELNDCQSQLKEITETTKVRIIIIIDNYTYPVPIPYLDIVGMVILL